MKPDLSKYPHFSGPIDNFSLLPTQGFCNENYSFTQNNKHYLLRKFKDQKRDRKLEFTIQNLAYQQGIAAKAILLDEEDGLMICEFLEGHHKDILCENDLKDLATLLKKLHLIKLDTKTINVEEQFHQKPEEVLKAFEILSHCNTENVLCHNDLNPRNILFSNKIKLIDWEYASINDRYFDLASICVEFHLKQNDELLFVKSYFNADEEIELKKLHAYKVIYSVLCKQWFEELQAK